MNPSSSSSLSSPPLYKSSSRPQSSTNRETPSIIPLDYNYQIMAPSALRPQTSRYNLVSRSSTRQSNNSEVDMDMDEDLPYSSLFGDPVPPPPPDDFLTSAFQPSHYLRSTSVDLTSEEEQTLGQTMTLSNSALPQRLFPQVPYTTLMGRRFSNTSPQRNFEIMPSSIPRLKPPDIQILPNSSGGSSSDPQNSPNYLLLTPQDITRKPSVYDTSEEPADVSELKETYTISDAHSIREFMQSTTRKSSTPEDTLDLQALSPSQILESPFPRQFSNESYSSGEWFRSGNLDYPEFNKMPKLRPSSKNVMSIKRDEMPMNSPVAAMINDSNGSSSGEERLLEATQTLDKPSVCLDSLQAPERPPSPSPSCLRSLDETIVLTPREYIKQRRKSIYPTQLVEQEPADEEEHPPPIPPKPHLIDENDLVKTQAQTPLKREVSPVIIKDSITTGGDYRVDQPRLHKKTSFTIISDKSPQSSQPQSPRYLRTREHTSASLIPTKQISLPKHQLQRKSLSSTQLKLPHLMPPSLTPLAADDSPRPSVQFDMTGRHSPSKLPPQKGILQHKESLTSSQDTLPTQHMRRRSSVLPPMAETPTRPQMKSCEALPLITDPYRTSIPRLNRAALELGPESAVFPPGALPRPLKPNPNPTRKQKGLLKVLNHEDTLSRIPLKSNWSSMDDLWLERKRKSILSPMHDKTIRRRSSSTSPSRRSSTQTTSDRRSSNLSTVTTSDFSFRRPSIATKPKTPQTQRRKSVFQLPSPAARRKSSSTSSVGTTQSRPSRTKIAKPTTLSPIIGTPNKDSSSAQSPLHTVRPPAPSSESVSDSNSRRDSLSKIPIRSQANSRSNSRMSSHGGSRAASRTGSPSKEYSATAGRPRTVSPMKDYQELGGRTSQMGTSAGVHSRTSSPMKDFQELGGRLSQTAVRPGEYSRTTSPMKEYQETGGRISQMATSSGGMHSRTVSPMKEYQETGGRTSQIRSRTGSPMKDYPEMGRRSRAGSSMKDYQDRVEGRTSQIATSRSGSRASQYVPSQPGSRAQSRATSRNASRSTSRASTRPISLPGSRPTSRMEQAKDIANSRSNSRLSMHSSKRGGSISPVVGRKTPTKPVSARRKSVSLSPKSKKRGLSRRGSISPVGMKARGGRSRSRSKARTSPDRVSRSRIPVSHENGRSATKSPPSKKKSNITTDLRRTSSLKAKAKTPTKQPASAKKMPTSVRKPETSVKRTPSSVAKQGAMTKKPTGSIQKPAAVKREPSNVSKKPAISRKPATREPTSLSIKKKVNAAKTPILGKKNGKDAPADKKGQTKGAKEVGAKVESSKPTVSAETKEHTNDETAGVSKKTEEQAQSSATTTVAVPMLTTLKKQPSSVAIMCVSSKISLLKKRTDSNISKKTLDLLIPEVETKEMEVSAPSPTQQLAEMALAEGGSIPAAILEKSQKTLENIQKTVTEATEEIQKTINENLTDLKSLEQDMGLTSDSAGSPTPSVTTVVEKRSGSKKEKGESVSRQGTAEGTEGKSSSKSPLPPTQPIEAAVSVLNPDETHVTAASAMSNGSSQLDAGIAGKATAATAVAGTTERVSERAISVLPEVDCESANLQSYQGETAGGEVDDKLQSAMESGALDKTDGGATEDYETEAKRRSPDGQGGSQVGSGKGSGSQEYLENKSLSDEEEAPPKGCCRCCAKFCMPCRRLRCSRCCQRKKSSNKDEAEQPVLSATSSATTTHLEIVDEKEKTKTSCWQKLNCCRNCRKKPQDSMDSSLSLKKEERFKETSFRPMGPPKQSKCGLCLSKIFCCRSVNKIDPKTGDETEVKKCCFCIPCRKKRGPVQGSAVSSVAGGSTAAWEDPERGITATDGSVVEGQDVEVKEGCCKRFCNFLLCCRKKKVVVSDSRRPSIRAPPPEDNRRKLHADLIEYNSKMKGAIPVLPLWLAWFCAICNILIPGLGTFLSGLFCLCVGIPRFSQYDSAKARLGSFVINTIVAIAQLFCVLFCFVGWGWSIWWGTIMLKCAKKLSKIRKVERLEMEEEKRQAAAAEAAAAAAAATKAAGPQTVHDTEPAKT
ncbi:protein stum isoform X1 [Lucilia sericata]|uniref:protein stum isoform X1 n=1 Tax=Lucilia sericata TaxID=13632 RepID=UPI0018A83721|nr:protein stum isoform X1 [Lucilia sericata]XP_037811484.1 protein stum isoform X1 [Lucilia sericata]